MVNDDMPEPVLEAQLSVCDCVSSAHHESPCERSAVKLCTFCNRLLCDVCANYHHWGHSMYMKDL